RANIAVDRKSCVRSPSTPSFRTFSSVEKGAEYRHKFAYVDVQLFVSVSAPAKAAMLVFGVTIERHVQCVDQLCHASHSPSTSKMCFRLIVANKSRLRQFGKISTDKRADGQKGAI